MLNQAAVETKAKNLTFPFWGTSLLWAAALLFTINVAIVIWFYLSPNIAPKFGKAPAGKTLSYAGGKPSPFAFQINEKKRPLQKAAKLVPVLEQQAVQLDIPRQTINASYSRDAEVFKVLDVQYSMPRVTAAADARPNGLHYTR